MFLDGRMDGLKKASATEVRMAAEMRSKIGNKEYVATVLKEFFDALASGQTGQPDWTDRSLSPIKAEASDASDLDMTSDWAGSPHGDRGWGSVHGHNLSEQLQPSNLRSSSLKQSLMGMGSQLTPRSEAIRNDFESGVDALSNQLKELSTSVSDILPGMISAENVRPQAIYRCS